MAEEHKRLMGREPQPLLPELLPPVEVPDASGAVPNGSEPR
jgi:hypothetical protein